MTDERFKELLVLAEREHMKNWGPFVADLCRALLDEHKRRARLEEALRWYADCAIYQDGLIPFPLQDLDAQPNLIT